MHIAPALLGSMYSWFPELSENVVVLMYSAPSLVSAAVSLGISPVMNRLNKKLMLVLGMCSIILAGCLIVFTGGASFALSLAGTICTGIGYALIVSTSNTLLVENSAPGESSKAIGINMAVGCLGSMALTSVSGILAANGNWTHAYYLCFPVVVSLVLFILLFRQEKKAQGQVAQDATSQDAALQSADGKNPALFGIVLSVFFFMMLTSSAWNTNFSSYVIGNGIGTTANTGMIATLASLGGVIGGFFFTGFAVNRLKKLVVPISLLVVALPCMVSALGVKSIMVIYACSFVFMVFFQPAYSVVASSAGKLMPGAGVSIVNSVQGFTLFLGPYIINFIAGLLGGSLPARFLIGVIAAVIGALIAIPAMRKAQE